MSEGTASGSRLRRLVSQAKEHKQQLLCSFSYYFTFIGLGISVTAIGPTLLQLIELTHSNETQFAYVFTAKGFGYLVGSTSGRLYDKLDGHKLLFISILVSASLFVVVPFVSTIWGQGIVWFAIGVFTGSVDTGANTLVVWLWRDKVNPFMQALHLSYGVGAVLSPLVLAALHGKSLFWQYLTLAIPFGVAALPVIFNKSPKDYTKKEVEMKETLTSSPSSSSLKDVDPSSFSVDDDDEVSEQISLDDPPPALPPSLARRLRIEVVVFAALLLLLDVGAEVGFGNWLPAYSEKKLHFTKKEADYVSAVFWGTFTLGRAIAVVASLFVTPKAMLFTDTVGCSLSLVSLLLFQDSSLALWVCSFTFGLFIASVFPTVISLPPNLGVEITGADTSWMVVGASFGEMAVPVLIGLLQRKYSLSILVVVVLGTEVLGGLTFSLLLIRVKYLKGELKGSLSSLFSSLFTSLVKGREGREGREGEKFSKLNDVITADEREL